MCNFQPLFSFQTHSQISSRSEFRQKCLFDACNFRSSLHHFNIIMWGFIGARVCVCELQFTIFCRVRRGSSFCFSICTNYRLTVKLLLYVFILMSITLRYAFRDVSESLRRMMKTTPASAVKTLLAKWSSESPHSKCLILGYQIPHQWHQVMSLECLEAAKRRLTQKSNRSPWRQLAEQSYTKLHFCHSMKRVSAAGREQGRTGLNSPWFDI